MLNDQQKAAVTHNQGPMLVIAGAGTGKTRVITERIAHILEQGWARADQILALTFTEKAAAEMEERLDQRLPIGYASIQVSTFHAFCEKLLRQYGIDIGLSPGFKILEGVNQWKFLKDHLFEFELSYYRPLGNPNKFIDDLLQHFSKAKEEMVSPEDYLKVAETRLNSAQTEEETLEAKKFLELAKAYEKYENLLHKSNFQDFSGLQYQVLRLLNERPNIKKHLQEKFQYVLVDEYQDTNIAQNQIVDQLAAGHQNLMVVGDDDQSIYKFRGAAISNILQFEEKYPKLKKVVLTENYRSHQTILDFAYTSIQKNNPDRLEVRANLNKKLTGQTPGDEESVTITHCTTIDQEVAFVLEKIRETEVKLSEIAILCRANSYALPFVEAFKKHNIPYQFLSEKGLYGKEEVRDLIAVLRVLSNPTDDMSLMRVLRMEWFDLKMISILEALQQAKKSYITLWTQLGKSPDFSQVHELFRRLIEFSKTHSVGETLYEFTQSIDLYQKLLARQTIEAEEQIVNIATFFQKIKRFEQENPNKAVLDFVNYLDLADEAGENPAAKFDVEGQEGIQISTIHAAKGLEFDTVFVPSLVSQRFPAMNRQRGIDLPPELIRELPTEGDFHVQEERRLFYVAVTRAKNKLYLLHSDFYSTSNAQNPRAKKPSVFLSEIREEAKATWVEQKTEGVEKFLKPSSLELPVDIKKEHESIRRFSHSQLTTFDACPRQYHYQYILKIPTPMSGAQSFGSAMHNTLQAFYQLVEQSKQQSLFEEYSEVVSLDRLLSIYEEKWIDVGFESPAHRDTLKKRGQEILETFFEHFKEGIPSIVYLEKSFKLKVGDYTLSGRIDRADRLADGTLEIIDYKTGKAKKQEDVDKDQQLMIYAMAAEEALGQPASKLTLYFLDDDVKISTHPDEKKMSKLKEKIIKTADKINQSNFTPTPSQRICKFCPFNKICDAAER